MKNFSYSLSVVRKRFLGLISMSLVSVFTLLCLYSLAMSGTLSEVTDFGSNPGNLSMFQYIPDKPLPAPQLVVVLHGCTQEASSYGRETGWTSLAEKWGFALLLPEQKASNNRNLCFNWFQLEDIRRGHGEAKSIAQMIGHMITNHDLDRDRIFITGLSAGGAMTSVMLATYPELFDGGAIIAGLPYKCSTSLVDAFSCMYSGKNLSPSQWGELVREAADHHGKWPRVSIWHGTSDSTVNPVNAVELMEQWTNVHGIDQVPDEQNVVQGYPHKVYMDATDKALVEIYNITGMGHGTPIDPGFEENQCGVESDYILDADICSSFYISKFWGLDNTDREPPRVSLARPEEGSQVSGLVILEANVLDNQKVDQVEFYVDNKLRRTDNTPPWQTEWDTSIECNGEHTLKVKAFDSSKNMGQSKDVNIDVIMGKEDVESPSVNLTFPHDGDVIRKTVNLTAKATDDCRVSELEFFVDDKFIGPGQDKENSHEWQLAWDTNSFQDGSHSISVKAFDSHNNMGIDDDTTVVIKKKQVSLAETFSDKNSDGDPFDQVSWTNNGWEVKDKNHTTEIDNSRSIFSYASSGRFCSLGLNNKTLSISLKVGRNQELSYYRMLDLQAGINIFTLASFQVLANGKVIDEENVIGANYAENDWTQRSAIDLSAFADQTIDLTFEIRASSNVCIEAFAKAWIDDIMVEDIQ